jgi:4-hydroxy-3-polyprenylbenzoate decarboxylase
MDVLDHSCSKLGFGGKMCIDGTHKWEEETDGTIPVIQPSPELTEKWLCDEYPEIKAANLSLLKDDIACIIVSVKKQRQGHIRELHRQLTGTPQLNGIKMILYVEHTVNPHDLATALWRFCNNLDPKRDAIVTGEEPGRVPCAGLDGTRKTRELDNFQRDWPNIIVADDTTIHAVDEKWHQLGIGPLIPSPSLRFKDQIYGMEAVVAD